MKLSDGIVLAYEKQWSMINTFTVEIDLAPYLINKIGKFEDDINLNIVSITTPDFSNQSIEMFIGNRWFTHNGRDELYRFNITFRDQDQMNLYRKFYNIYKLTKDQWFNDIKMTVNIKKDADWFDESDIKLMSFNNTIIENISNISFNNTTENQIAEFTVSFKCTTPNIMKGTK